MVCPYLIKIKEERWVKGYAGTEALDMACRYGDVEMVRLLIEHGATAGENTSLKTKMERLLSGENVNASRRAELEATRVPGNHDIHGGRSVWPTVLAGLFLVWTVLFVSMKPRGNG